jgi:hypothetical protein
VRPGCSGPGQQQRYRDAVIGQFLAQYRAEHPMSTSATVTAPDLAEFTAASGSLLVLLTDAT